jgi:hypothetical protein
MVKGTLRIPARTVSVSQMSRHVRWQEPAKNKTCFVLFTRSGIQARQDAPDAARITHSAARLSSRLAKRPAALRCRPCGRFAFVEDEKLLKPMSHMAGVKLEALENLEIFQRFLWPATFRRQEFASSPARTTHRML